MTGGARPDALVALTGCRVGIGSDIRASVPMPGLPVYLTGSGADSWIPVAAFAEAAAAFGSQGAALRCDVFPGRPHEVSPPERAMLAALLSDLSQGRRPAMVAAR